MDAFLTTLQRWDLHPVVDHFTVALLIVGVLIDLIASLVPNRMTLRYTALTLMILGAISAGASYYTGGMEADRIWNSLAGPAKEIFGRHAKLGTYMAVAFGVLALWRILIEAVGFFAGSRPIYLIVAIICAGVLIYIGSLGGQMVYTYGVGTALMEPPASPSASATPLAIPNEALPTVSVPSSPIFTPTPIVIPMPPATPAAIATPAAPLPTPAATP